MRPKEFFIADANRSKSGILGVMPHWYRRRKPNFERDVNYGYRLYGNCHDASLGMLVLGDDGIREDEDLITNLGATSATPMRLVRQLIPAHQPDTADRRNKGSVLSEKNWWPFYNDCWVMGGVHGKREFHLADTDWPDDSLLWDSGKSRPRMLGRELMILAVSGYSLRKSPLGMVFYNTDHMKAFNLTFKKIYELDPGSNKNVFLTYIKGAF